MAKKCANFDALKIAGRNMLLIFYEETFDNLLPSLDEINLKTIRIEKVPRLQRNDLFSAEKYCLSTVKKICNPP